MIFVGKRFTSMEIHPICILSWNVTLFRQHVKVNKVKYPQFMCHIQCPYQPLQNSSSNSKTVVQSYPMWKGSKVNNEYIRHGSDMNFHVIGKQKEHLKIIFQQCLGSGSFPKLALRPMSDVISSGNRMISATFRQISAANGRLRREIMCCMCVILYCRVFLNKGIFEIQLFECDLLFECL